MRSSILSIISVAGAAYAQSTAYEQCGGIGWSGSTTCVAGWTCTYSNPYYSQCLPCTGSCSTSSAAVSTSSTKSTTMATSTGTPTTTGSISTTLTGGGGSLSTGYPGTTLQSGYYWIRAVESPNYHQYLQTSPEYVTGIAILGNYTTAGQFNIVNGQLVELTSAGILYANVEVQANSSVTMLGMTFEATQNTYGTFDFSGDAVQWSVASIDRPNLSAWLVCANQQLFINLGAYDYMTPAGCADETIHYYNGATAID